MPTFPVRNFSGGLTDFPLDADPSQYEVADNLVIDEYAKLQTRPGTKLDITASEQRARVANWQRIGLLAPQEVNEPAIPTVLKQAGESLFFDDGTAQIELEGPDAEIAFPDVTDDTSFSYSLWNRHTLFTHEGPDWQKPVKVYREADGTLQLRTIGLPGGNFSATTATGGSGGNYIYAFVYKYTYNVGDTEFVKRGKPFLKEFTNIGTATPSSAPNIALDGLADLVGVDGEHYDDANIKIEIYRTAHNGSVLYFVAEVDNLDPDNPAGGAAAYTDATTDDTLIAAGNTIYTTAGVLANDRPPKCKYIHSTTDFTYYANGFEVGVDSSDLQYLPNRGWVSKAGSPGSVPASSSFDVEEAITGISSIKSVPIVFGANSVYRLDGFFDAFGRGGVFPRKISDGVGCIGHLSIVQTLDGLFFAGNDGFYFTDGYKIMSLSAEDFRRTYRTLVSTELKKKRMYGSFDPNNKRVLWSCWSDDLDPSRDNNCIFVLDLSSRKFTRWTSGYSGPGPYHDEQDNDAVREGAQLFLPETIDVRRGDFVYAYDLGLKTWYVDRIDSITPGGHNLEPYLNDDPVTLRSQAKLFRPSENGIEYYENIWPTSLLFANNTLYQGDGRGFTLIYDDNRASDVFVDGVIGLIQDNFTNEVVGKDMSILTKYSGAMLSLGTTDFRKWVNGVLIKARPRADIETIVAMRPFGENDDNDLRQQLKDVFSASLYPWGTPLLTYGDPRLWRRRQQVVDVKRRFPSNSLRCGYKQLHIDTAFHAIDNSDRRGVVEVEAPVLGELGDYPEYSVFATLDIEKKVTFSNIINDPVVNHWMAFEFDGYVKLYKVIRRLSNTELLILDLDNDISLAEHKWVLFAYPHNAYFNLVEYSYFYEVIGPSQEAFTSTEGLNSSDG